MSWKYAEEILDKVSRTFALNIRVLGKNLRKPVLLAYLYMRIADTIEDDADLPAEEKVLLLKKFSKVVSEAGNNIEEFTEALPQSWKNSKKDDCALCCNAGIVIPLLAEFPEPIARAVKSAVEEMCKGMTEFVLRKSNQTDDWFIIESEEDLNRYCYFVAGLVGNMLTELFCIAGKNFSEERKQKLRERAVSFGIALQLVNIIKDVQDDFKRNVCFVPMEFCRLHGINSAQQFMQPETLQEHKNSVINLLKEKAKKHLQDAAHYIKTLPRREYRMRLFCLWPSLMAADNLRVIAKGGTKITRETVKKIIRRSTVLGWSNMWVERELCRA
jgi:farnesyl-diphosphate farnesyltransferase